MKKQKNRKGVRRFLLIALALFILFFLVGPKYSIKSVDLSAKFLSPDSEHWLGTDNLGRDVYSLLASGGLRTLEVTFLGVAISFFLGVSLGLVSAFCNRFWHTVIQLAADLSLILPSFILALVFSAIFGFSPMLIGIVLGLGNMGDYIIQSHDLACGIKKQEFIEAERIVGLTDTGLIFFHIFPNIRRQLLVLLGNRIGGMIIQYAGLAYIGLGTDYSNPDWGSILYQYRSFLIPHPYLILAPAAAICFITVCAHGIFDSGEHSDREMTIYD